MINASHIVITRTEDHGTITLRGPNFALDLTCRPDAVVRAGWHSALDDDPQGRGVTTRLHAYGKERLLEIKLLVDEGLEEIERQERGA
jgi:hypothetical protein